MNTPTRPCPTCASTRFVCLREAFVELASRGASEPARNPRFSLTTCVGCGRIEWFTDPVAAVAYWRSLGGVVDTVEVSEPPYR